MSMRRFRLPAAAAALLLGMTATACGEDASAGENRLVLGYFPNVTHAPALVGVEEGIYADALGDGIEFSTQTFNAGPDAINAVFSGDVDATFVGPNPSINGWEQSEGAALRVIAGSTSGGSGLVVRPDITSVDDLKGATLATPQLGNTQDVALRWWATGQGWAFDTEGGGDIAIIPQENSEIVDAFLTDRIDGAWVPEPYLSRLVLEGGGHVLVDEADQWPDTGGEYVTTQLIVSADYLAEHPDNVRRLLQGHIATVDRMNADPQSAQRAVGDHFERLSGRPLHDDILTAAFGNLTFTVDPVASSLADSARHAEAVGLLDPVDLDGVYSLDILNDLLSEAGHDRVSGLEGD
ncbi:NitT/TauT family transport system substrate-binding protein [Nocardiopsis mwathae]|uniref:NitT/TauT family transport system substrate-binding protein n=1 Tax=Nocardiopsis mwathae TaxID=1472723 RepID=A0A7X0D6A5_9ACTN|nr:ABC transporter substrate-binding protein [Nocardiopsis mwathae]MBB6171904.1 NitT/TauT family transport system substrate-binding protein [Nocardiopsis mwathae]